MPKIIAINSKYYAFKDARIDILLNMYMLTIAYTYILQRAWYKHIFLKQFRVPVPKKRSSMYLFIPAIDQPIHNIDSRSIYLEVSYIR